MKILDFFKKEGELFMHDIFLTIFISLGWIIIGHLFISLTFTCNFPEQQINYSIPFPSVLSNYSKLIEKPLETKIKENEIYEIRKNISGKIQF